MHGDIINDCALASFFPLFHCALYFSSSNGERKWLIIYQWISKRIVHRSAKISSLVAENLIRCYYCNISGTSYEVDVMMPWALGRYNLQVLSNDCFLKPVAGVLSDPF